MIGATSVKYAFRSLTRHTRRTVLSMMGVGIGCGLALLATAWIRGSTEMQVRAISESGGGHLRIVPRGWTETHDNALRLTEEVRCLELVKELPNFKVAVRRARTNAFLAFGNRTAGVEMVGLEPEFEQVANRIVYKAEIAGRYLKPDDQGCVVIGSVLARRLDVDVDDDLYVTMVGRNDIQSAMLRIVGLLTTGSRDIDSTLCHVTLDEMRRLTGYDRCAEISVMLNDYRSINSAQKWLSARLPEGDHVITWREINPALAGGVESDQGFTRVLIGIIIIVVSLGIAAAQLTAVLERRTELAILCALGMRARQVVALMAIEALIIGLGGSIIGLLSGGSFSYYLAVKGVDFGAILGNDLSFGDVLIEPHIYADFGMWLIWYALAISLVASIAANLYPAWFASRTEPASALRTE